MNILMKFTAKGQLKEKREMYCSLNLLRVLQNWIQSLVSKMIWMGECVLWTCWKRLEGGFISDEEVSGEKKVV